MGCRKVCGGVEMEREIRRYRWWSRCTTTSIASMKDEIASWRVMKKDGLGQACRFFLRRQRNEACPPFAHADGDGI